ncbi:MAG: zinc ribbon domain-containing protein [Candidatus Bathyarchaeota archaeon]|nr:MAG: zinc ribbon domain-containing protein [Candidatus Bathyarchaeota archaeon]
MTTEETKYCYECGALIDRDVPHCPACGARQPSLDGQTATRDRKYDTKTKILMILLGIRLFSQTALVLYSQSVEEGFVFLIYAVAYLFSLQGIYRRKVRGPLVLMGFTALDSLLSLFIISSVLGDIYDLGQVLGSLIVNMIIIYLGYNEYRKITS